MAIRAILTDIEGTTTSLSFVHEVLFPYAASHIADFVLANAASPAVKAAIDLSCQEPDAHCAPNDLATVITQLQAWMAADKKVTPLKTLQGLLWAEGYQRGDLIGHVYDDAVMALRTWQQQGIKLYIYSSGSVQAQQLLFGHSVAGDLNPLFSGYFDTQIGHKRVVASYQRIAQQLALPAEQILFLSDIREELDAAALAGMKTCCLVRENQSIDQLAHPWVHHFAAIDLNNY